VAGFELLRCRGCGFVFVNLSDEEIEAANRDVFDRRATDVYERRQSRIDALWFDRLARRLSAGRAAGRVLDIGCGNGLLLRRFLARGWSAEGVDFSSWAEPFAREHGFVLHNGAIESLELPGGRFDLVTSTSTLEHVARPVEHVREILRMLAPGGIAYLAGIPNYGSLSIRLGLSAFSTNRPPMHVNYFTPATMQRMLERAGVVAPVASARVSTYGIPELHHLLKRLTARKRGAAAPRRRASAPAGYRRRGLDALRAMAVAVHYRAGRPLGLGDKLEVVIRKKA
jgi:SAM-dependent methyltransferase